MSALEEEVAARMKMTEVECLGSDLARTNDRLFALEQRVGTKQLPIPVCHAIHELRLMYGELKSRINSLEPPAKVAPTLFRGQIYIEIEPRDHFIACVVKGAAGDLRVRVLPQGHVFMPDELDWDNFRLMGMVQECFAIHEDA